jgi:hypothetical protein
VRLFLVLLAAVSLLFSGCAKKEGGAEEQASAESSPGEMMPGKDVTSTPGIESIPGTDVPEAPLPGLAINPFFDEAGTTTETAVARGGQFKLYVMAETVDPYETTSAQLRLQMPPGIKVLYTVETDKKMSSLGQYDFNYMVVYECTPPGRFVVVSYVCEVQPEFQGGEILVLPGFLADNHTFLGFATCNEFQEVRAAGGTATIKLK